MPDIFISYAHEDERRIQHLACTLEDQGWSVFWDRRIPAGQTWRSHIDKAISDARCMIVAWSNYSIDSSWVCEEAEDGKQRGILIPILLDSVQPPIGFRSIQAADLTDWQPGCNSPCFEQLLYDLNSVLGTIPSPSSTTRLANPESDTFKLLGKPSQEQQKTPTRRPCPSCGSQEYEYGHASSEILAGPGIFRNLVVDLVVGGPRSFIRAVVQGIAETPLLICNHCRALVVVCPKCHTYSVPSKRPLSGEIVQCPQCKLGFCTCERSNYFDYLLNKNPRWSWLGKAIFGGLLGLLIPILIHILLRLFR
jgi:hypothetical protein